MNFFPLRHLHGEFLGSVLIGLWTNPFRRWLASSFCSLSTFFIKPGLILGASSETLDFKEFGVFEFSSVITFPLVFIQLLVALKLFVQRPDGDAQGAGCGCLVLPVELVGHKDDLLFQGL